MCIHFVRHIECHASLWRSPTRRSLIGIVRIRIHIDVVRYANLDLDERRLISRSCRCRLDCAQSHRSLGLLTCSALEHAEIHWGCVLSRKLHSNPLSTKRIQRLSYHAARQRGAIVATRPKNSRTDATPLLASVEYWLCGRSNLISILCWQATS